jgi:putative type IV prepilin leader peptidase
MNNITLETTFIISSKMQYYDYFNQMKKQYAIEILFIYFNGFLKIASFYSILLGFN